MGCLKLHKDYASDLRVIHRKKAQKGQKMTLNDYPFGLKHKGYNGTVSANSNSVASKLKYNGKELEEELGKDTYAYGWRDYDPAIGRFNKIDRFAEKYFSMTPYQYAANSPIKLYDVKGDSIRVSGSKSSQRKFKRIIKKGLGRNYKVKINKQGSVTVTAKNRKSNGKLNAGQQRFLNVLDNAINNTNDTSFNLVDKSDALSERIPIGDNGTHPNSASPNTHTIDVGDAIKFREKGKLKSSGVLGHEIDEGFQMQVAGHGPGASHRSGVGVEQGIIGLQIQGQPSLNANRTELSVTVQIPGGTSSTVIIKLKDQNVKKLENNK